MSKKLSAIDMRAIKYRKQILEGTLLCIDPSVGSISSMPGYAVFENGELTESGIIQLSAGSHRHNRLFALAETLRDEFEMPDLLAIEYIPPVRYTRSAGGGMNNRSRMSLYQAVGVIISCFDSPCVEVPASAWRYHKPEGYDKSDEHDAIAIGLCLVNKARSSLND